MSWQMWCAVVAAAVVGTAIANLVLSGLGW